MYSRHSTRSRSTPPVRWSDRAGLLADGGLPGLAQTRQVLVVGTGLTGLALATFLQQSGQDPVLVDASTPPSVVTTVWPPGLRLLDRLDVGDAVRSAGRPLDAVTVRTRSDGGTEERTLTADGNASTPLIVDAPFVRDRIADGVAAATTLSTGIACVTERPDAVEVEFENGVREYFDLVVGADGPESTVRALADRARPDWTQLTTLEVADCERERGVAPLDGWQDAVVVQALPSPDGAGRVLRLTTAASDRDRVDASLVARWALPDAAVDASEWTERLSTAEWTPAWQAGADGGEWGAGRVAYCGSAAFPTPWVTGLGAALALEDAWVLADELARCPDGVADAVARYGDRRRRRLQTVLGRTAAVNGRCAYPGARMEPLATTSRLRAAALGSLCSGSLAALQRNVPGRL